MARNRWSYYNLKGKMNMVGQSDVSVSRIRQNIMESEKVLQAGVGRWAPPATRRKKKEEEMR